MKTFIKNCYGRETILHEGQKVYCYYYGEWEHLKEERCNPPMHQRILDKPYKPAKHGIIIGDAGVHPYWLSHKSINGKPEEQYLFVEFKEYLFPKAIPITCIQDAKEHATATLKGLERDKDRIGEKGYSFEAYSSLLKTAEEGLKF